MLVAVDLSLASNDVLRGAVGLAAEEAVQLTVIHAVEGVEAADAVPSLVPWMLPEYRTRILEDARRAVEGVVSSVPADVDTRVQVSTGSAAPHDSPTRGRRGRRSRGRGKEPGLQDVWIYNPARPSQERSGATGDPQRGPSYRSRRTATRRLTEAAP